MLSFVSLAAIGITLFWAINSIKSLQRNIELARASGFQYHVSPIGGMPGWLFIASERLILSILSRIPWIKDTKLPVLFTTHRSWTWGQRMREQLGETYMIVSPSQLYLNCNDPEGILQLSHRRNDFVKPQELYSIVDIFGESIISSEGDTWKRHRKIVAPAFAEKSNLLVWEESLRQADGLIKIWSRLPGNTKELMRVADAAENYADLALHVISGAGFGVSQQFEGGDEDIPQEHIIPGFNTKTLAKGHVYTFKGALQDLVANLVWLMLLPRWLLERSPFEVHKRLVRAHTECTNYFRELTQYKEDLIDRGNMVDARTMDLMAPMVKASQSSPEESKGLYLTKQDVIADSWILLFAGHETTANTLHYTTLLLAMDLATQLALQKDIDSVVKDRPRSEWTYEKDMGTLYNSLVGACFFETLRLIPPILEIPRACRPNPQTLTLNGQTYTVPLNTFIHMDNAAVHRNQKYWPHAPSKRTGGDHDMDDYVPHRWLSTDTSQSAKAKLASMETENIDGLEKASFESTSGGLLVPAKGTYLPFADGARACPGRRFAQVELTAVLTSIFKTYSVELEVSRYASDEEVARMNKMQRKGVYDQAIVAARKIIDNSLSTVTVKMLHPVPFRLVKRGHERFLDCYL